MNTWVLVILVLSSCLTVTFGLLLRRSAQRLFEFDDLYELLVHDLDTNIDYFDKLLETPTFTNSPEVVQAQKNMNVMRVRLDEYVSRMEELTHRKLRKQKEKANLNPPVVV